MAEFKPKTKSDIKIKYINKVKVNTSVNDFLDGSTVDSLCETHARQQFEQQFQMKKVLEADDLNNLFGTDLDDKAQEAGIEARYPSVSSTGTVEVIDTTISKKTAQTTSGGAYANDMILNVGNIVGVWPTSGYILIGSRTEDNYETVYFTDFVAGVFTLQTGLQFDHGSNENIVLKTVGDRIYSKGDIVYTKETQTQDKVRFKITSDYIIYDGDDRAYNVSVECLEVGVIGNVPANSITEFETNKPFNDVALVNPAAITNGDERESDSSLRGRIKDAPATLAKGVRKAIERAALSATFGSRRVRFVKCFESSSAAEPSDCYIDDGSGFIPTTEIILEEIICENAVGGEYLFRLNDNPKMIKGILNGGRTINLYKNGAILLEEGTHFKLNYLTGEIKLIEKLLTGESLQAGNTGLGVVAYHRYTGLLQEAQWKISGKISDEANYEGVAAFGAHVDVKVPEIQDIDIQIELFAVSKAVASPLVIQAISNYVNNVGIGNDIILDQIRKAILSVNGVSKVNFTEPLGDTVVPIGFLARIQASNIIIN